MSTTIISMDSTVRKRKVKRYTLQQKIDIVLFVERYNKQNGIGGLTAAMKRYGFYNNTYSGWVRDEKVVQGVRNRAASDGFTLRADFPATLGVTWKKRHKPIKSSPSKDALDTLGETLAHAHKESDDDDDHPIRPTAAQSFARSHRLICPACGADYQEALAHSMAVSERLLEMLSHEG